jgi:hypothetical protein
LRAFIFPYSFLGLAGNCPAAGQGFQASLAATGARRSIFVDGQPSYSYYDRFISSITRGLPLYETRTCFRQVLSNLLSPDLF